MAAGRFGAAARPPASTAIRVALVSAYALALAGIRDSGVFCGRRKVAGNSLAMRASRGAPAM
jgi:hypothetical protein